MSSFLQTLILNQHYRPHEVIDWRDATTRLFASQPKIEVLVQYDEVIAHVNLRSFPELRKALRQVIGGLDVESIDLKVPAVAVLRRKLSSVKSGVKFSKINVCLRDDFKCQYCGDKLPMSQLNYDHVVPRSKGGKTVWENISMACYPCNDRKGNKLLSDSGMTILKAPVKPKVLPMNEPFIDTSRAPEEWVPYITRKTG